MKWVKLAHPGQWAGQRTVTAPPPLHSGSQAQHHQPLPRSGSAVREWAAAAHGLRRSRVSRCSAPARRLPRSRVRLPRSSGPSRTGSRLAARKKGWNSDGPTEAPLFISKNDRPAGAGVTVCEPGKRAKRPTPSQPADASLPSRGSRRDGERDGQRRQQLLNRILYYFSTSQRGIQWCC
jgi:hypothetical protein